MYAASPDAAHALDVTGRGPEAEPVQDVDDRAVVGLCRTADLLGLGQSGVPGHRHPEAVTAAICAKRVSGRISNLPVVQCLPPPSSRLSLARSDPVLAPSAPKLRARMGSDREGGGG